MRRRYLNLAIGFGLSLLLLGTVTFAQFTGSGHPQIHYVPDVISQFNQLALRPDPQTIAEGGNRLVSGDYVGAIDQFKGAVGRAQSL